MYQEDAEYYEHQRSLVEIEMERRNGTGMVDMKRDDWVCEGHSDGPVMGETFYCDGSCNV